MIYLSQFLNKKYVCYFTDVYTVNLLVISHRVGCIFYSYMFIWLPKELLIHRGIHCYFAWNEYRFCLNSLSWNRILIENYVRLKQNMFLFLTPSVWTLQLFWIWTSCVYINLYTFYFNHVLYVQNVHVTELLNASTR